MKASGKICERLKIITLNIVNIKAGLRLTNVVTLVELPQFPQERQNQYLDASESSPSASGGNLDDSTVHRSDAFAIAHELFWTNQELFNL